MRQPHTTFLFSIIVLFNAISSLAAVVYVRPDAPGPVWDGLSWQTAFPKIKTAIDAAGYGDQVWVAGGTYTGDLKDTWLKNGIKIYGGFEGDETSLDQRDWVQHQTIVSRSDVPGDPVYKFLICKGTDSTTVVDGLIFQFGRTFWFTPDNECLYPSEGLANCIGGAIFAYSPHPDTPACLRVLNCTFLNNSGSFGSAIGMNLTTGSGGLVVENCRFEENHAGDGGLYIWTGSAPQWKFEVRNSVFFQNKATRWGAPAISFVSYNADAFLNVQNTVFEGNFCEIMPGTGAVFCFKQTGKFSKIDRCIFIKNNAGTSQFLPGTGGAVQGSKIEISASLFEENQAYIGGAINAWNITIVNSLFLKNKAYYQAGAISGSGFLRIINCSFLKNLSLNKSIITNVGYQDRYYNNIFFKNETADGGPLFEVYDTLSVSRCAFGESSLNSIVTPFPSSVLNFSPDNLLGIDPMFRDTAAKDYRLKGCSPLIDRGDSLYLAGSGINNDLADEPRTQGNNVDIGPYETPRFYVESSWQNISCYGEENGTAALLPAGGFPPYTFLWNNGQQDSSLVQLSPGFYTAIIHDGDLCADTVYILITQPDPLQFVASVIPNSSSQNPNGSIAITAVTGGTPPYHYNWSTGSIDSVISGLSPGIYTVSVTEEQGCTAIWTFEVQFVSGVGEGSRLTALLIYPNPAYETAGLMGDFPDQSPPAFLRLYDTNGRQVRLLSLPSDSSAWHIPLQGLAAGYYTIRLFSAKGVLIGSGGVVKQN